MIDLVGTYGANCFPFLVDNTVTDVELPIATTGVLEPDPSNAMSSLYFAPGDSFTLISFGVSLPYSFIQGALYNTTLTRPGYPALSFGIAEDTIVGITPLSVAGISKWTLPYLTAEIMSTFFVDLGALTAAGLYFGHKFQLVAGFYVPPAISQVGVPAALNATTQYAAVWAKVEHSAPFTV